MKILMIDKGMPYDFDTPYNEPLGGSESSFLFLSQGLEELGHSIVLLNTSETNVPQQRNNRILHNVNTLKSILDQSDVVILNRCLPEEPFAANKRIFYYSHDAYDKDHILYWMVNKKVLGQVEKILCVSEWQRDTFNKYYDVPLDKMVVIGNLIPIDMFQGYTERKENKLIFASIPYKGLEMIPDLFSDICKKAKRYDLELDVYSSMELYGDDKGDEKYIKTFSELQNMNNVNLYKPTNLRELIHAFKTSSVMIHPHLYHESFGINFVLAQGAGCIPITVNSGAVHEVIDNHQSGLITKGKTILNKHTYEDFIDLTLAFMESSKNQIKLMRQNAYFNALKWNYVSVAKKVLNLFTNI